MPYERTQQIEQRFHLITSLLEDNTHNARRLAEALGVSRPTIHRMITELRRRGKVIRAIRDTNGWHYEMANEASSSRFRGKKSMRRGN